MFLPWGNRVFECLDFEDERRFWKYIGKSWTEELEDAVEKSYREARSLLGDISEPEFLNIIVKDFIAEVEIGNPAGAEAFLNRIEENKLELAEDNYEQEI